MTDEKGFIKTDKFLESSLDGIFALGDAIGTQPFKHAANYEAECIYKTLNGNDTPVDYSAMPRAIFSSPQIAAVGSTEQ